MSRPSCFLEPDRLTREEIAVIEGAEPVERSMGRQCLRGKAERGGVTIDTMVENPDRLGA